MNSENYEMVLVLKPYVCFVLVNETGRTSAAFQQTNSVKCRESETQGFKTVIFFLSHASDPKLF